MDADNSLSLWFSILYRYRKNYLMKKLERYGVIGGYPYMILAIHKNAGTNQEQISNILKTDKAAVTRAVKKLEKEDYILREPDLSDKRAYRVTLTPKAEAVVPEIRKALQEWEQIAVAGIPEDMLPVLRQYVKQMSDNAVAFQM
ncbi:transcriptional regulator, MarR family [Sporobacter termitidis DSM 10068]|uniref:Transcriptional regulator, MarR family n=1 Tax=Sporobacter termitidis DSM 10068 TaxID=1123282 RepID=A0A1M5TAR4_9FIRM|nr:MarR family transcriptional regulator [Sporobacter termitidis]SHH47766.1 transcriptional regulator, MarR family [Sporobacter termitidis DSM 10068]